MDNTVLMGFGLASSAGLNAFIPLLIIGIADRASTTFNLDRPYDFLSSTAGILIVLTLLSIEIIVDKVPRADHINDLIQSAVRPAAGAVLFMAAVNEDDALHPLVAMVFGLLIAGAIHWYKTTQRPAITINTRGLGTPLISIIEDAISAVVALLSVVLPLIGALAVFGGAFTVRRAYRWINRSGLVRTT